MIVGDDVMATVLIVEDEPVIRMILKEALELFGHRVSEAQDGLEALQVMDSRPRPDVLLMDLFMPRLGGKEVVQRMRAREDLKDIPIVLLTGALYREEDFPPEGSYHSILYKPFDLMALNKLVKALVPQGRSA